MSQQGRNSDDGIAGVELLTGNVGGPVGPDGAGNINVIGSAPISVSGNPGTNTLTITSDGTIAIQFDSDSGSAAPAAGIITFTGTTHVAGTTPLVTSAAGSTVTIDAQISQALAAADSTKIGMCNFDSSSFAVDADGFVTIEGAFASSYVTNSGTANPIAGQLDILGDDEFISTSGATNAVTIVPTDNFKSTGVFSWDGCVIEKGSSTVTSDGATITLALQKSGGGDLTMIFSDGFTTLDCTPPVTVSLTAGTDTVPIQNYIFIPKSTKTLTANTTGFPSTECIRVAIVICQSAASLQTQGPYKFHQWIDDTREANDQGHTTDLSFWIRNQFATYLTGISQTYTITTNVGIPDNVILETTSGTVLQLHVNNFPAFSDPVDYYVINDFTTPFTVVTDLNALLTDSTGSSMSGRYFSLVIWGVVNQTTGDCKIFVNLPSGSYANETSLLEDIDSYATYTIPTNYKGVGFLISEWKLRHQSASGGTWTSIDEIDLRGFIPSLTPGGSTTSPNEFDDSVFRIFDNGDDTKKIAFEASGITTSTTRTITMADYDIDMNDVCISAPTDSGTATPALGALTFAGGTGVTTSGSSSTVTIDVAGGGITWNVETGTSANMAVNNGYIANNAGTVTFTLPDTAPVGSMIRVTGIQGAWSIAQNAGETIYFGTSATTTGVGGSLTSTDDRDAVELVCVVADTDWNVLSSVGNITVV